MILSKIGKIWCCSLFMKLVCNGSKKNFKSFDVKKKTNQNKNKKKTCGIWAHLLCKKRQTLIKNNQNSRL
jgi:hypothetical protein